VIFNNGDIYSLREKKCVVIAKFIEPTLIKLSCAFLIKFTGKKYGCSFMALGAK
jgi:hypothetical protein